MTRRERLEAKVEKREEWAAKAQARSEARFAAAGAIADRIPMGQPILVGHHSERRARADAQRIHSNMDKGCEESALSRHHQSKAHGLEAQLDASIYADDVNATSALQARIAAREAVAAFYKRVNAAWKKTSGDDKAARLAALVEAGVLTAPQAADLAVFFGRCHWEDKPFPSYATTNLRANIRRDQARLQEIQQRAARALEAEAAGGITLVDLRGIDTEFVRVTFAEKPAPEVLQALRSAGFWWRGGSWTGKKANLPAAVAAMVPAQTSPERSAK